MISLLILNERGQTGKHLVFLMPLLTCVRTEQREPGEQEHVIMDGKTLRGTPKHAAEDQKKMHQVSLYETRTGIILKEQMVNNKKREQPISSMIPRHRSKPSPIDPFLHWLPRV